MNKIIIWRRRKNNIFLPSILGISVSLIGIRCEFRVTKIEDIYKT